MADNMLGEGNDCLLDLTSSCEVAADLSVLRLYQLILPFRIVQYIHDNQSIIITRVHAGNTADLSVLRLYQQILPFRIVQYIQDNQSIIIIRVHAGNKVRIRPVSSLHTMYEMWAELKY